MTVLKPLLQYTHDFVATTHAVWLREVLRMLRDSGQIVGAFSRPVLWVMIFGIGLTPYFRTGLRETTFMVPFTYIQFILPAVVVLNLMYPAIQSAVSLIWDREFGFSREVFASPTPRGAIFFGKLVGGATIAMAQGLLVMILLPAANVPVSYTSLFAALLPMVAVALAFTAIGLLLASRMSSFQGFGVFANTLILPAFFLGSSIFPLDPSLSMEQALQSFPAWLVFLVHANPVTYAIDELRWAMLSYRQFDPVTARVVLSAFVLIPIALAYHALRR
ncbi:ABC transporter permease [Spiribacter roseus]|jgi:ABC-2 type transport system permease protein|uniref:ABC transporter permease n=1 Tax=Spiribacter roseus TaxID=1855875 RepID=UPI0011D1657A|nr:ABC transporter permease [Spiribacter roseus]KAF0284190.1 ABC transporter [Spiribacter roseus]